MRTLRRTYSIADWNSLTEDLARATTLDSFQSRLPWCPPHPPTPTHPHPPTTTKNFHSGDLIQMLIIIQNFQTHQCISKSRLFQRQVKMQATNVVMFYKPSGLEVPTLGRNLVHNSSRHHQDNITQSNRLMVRCCSRDCVNDVVLKTATT